METRLDKDIRVFSCSQINEMVNRGHTADPLKLSCLSYHYADAWCHGWQADGDISHRYHYPQFG